MIVFVITFIGLWGPAYLLFGPKHGPYKFLAGAVVGLELVFAFAYVVGSINDPNAAQAQPLSPVDLHPAMPLPADGKCPKDYIAIYPFCAYYVPSHPAPVVDPEHPDAPPGWGCLDGCRSAEALQYRIAHGWAVVPPLAEAEIESRSKIYLDSHPDDLDDAERFTRWQNAVAVCPSGAKPQIVNYWPECPGVPPERGANGMPN